MSDTPVGERPITGGRVRQYESDADRHRAWRERQKARQVAGTASPPPSTSLAAPQLVMILERLTSLFSAHQGVIADQAGRVEEAIAALADPELVAESLEMTRAETARELAEASERVALAQQSVSRAEAQTRAAVAEKIEAESAANDAWVQLERMTAEMTGLNRTLEESDREASEAAKAHKAELAALHESHQVLLADERDTAARQLQTVRDQALQQVKDADAARARAEGTAQAVREDAQRQQSEADRRHDTAVERLVGESRQAAEALEARHKAECDAIRSRYEGELVGERARITANAEVLDMLKSQLTRQVTDAAALLAQAQATAQAQASRADEAVAARLAAELRVAEIGVRPTSVQAESGGPGVGDRPSPKQPASGRRIVND